MTKDLQNIFNNLKNTHKVVDIVNFICSVINYYETQSDIDEKQLYDVYNSKIKRHKDSILKSLREIELPKKTKQFDWKKESEGKFDFSSNVILFDNTFSCIIKNSQKYVSQKNLSVSILLLSTLECVYELKTLFDLYSINELTFTYALEDSVDSMFSDLGLGKSYTKSLSDLFGSFSFPPSLSSIFPQSNDDKSEGDLNDDQEEEVEHSFYNPFMLSTKKDSKSGTPNLDKFAKNLVEVAETFDPVIGRESELSQLLEILNCKKKNNAILIGEPGVGKTSIVELLAQRIKTSQVPKNFLGKKIYSLNLNSLVAGTKFRGQYEERLQGIIDEVTSDPNIIVFIDEIHNMIGNGSSDGNGDAANILKPYLSKGTFQCIGSTTFKEYRKYIEKDGALKRRFQNIQINEPTKEHTKTILENIKPVYEKYHNVKYSEEVLDICLNLSERYITDKFFPDKAIDILDLSGSLARLEESKETSDIYINTKKELTSLFEQKREFVKNEEFEKAIEIREKEKELNKILEKEENRVPVRLEHILSSITKRTKIPIDSIGSSDLDKLRKINSVLGNTVIGQEKAIKEIVMSLQRNSLGLRDPKKPIASLLFVGPTGSGKTYLCKTLAKEFFGSEENLIKFDMSEFGEKHEITKLTGAAASYVGYDDEPLFEQVRKNPYSVVLFDEIEKAAPEIFQIFLSILDEGHITLSNGTKVNFKNTIIVFTGNIGTKELQLFGNGMGFAGSNTNNDIRKDSIVNNAIKKTFAPEFINRLSKTVVFNNLTKENMMIICDLEIKKLSERLETKNIKLNISDNIKELIISKCDLKYGARDLQRNVTKYIEEEICSKLLESNINPENKEIKVDVKENEEIEVCF